MTKSSVKISKTSMEKSLRINLQGKISTNKSSKRKISIFQRKNLHEQIFIKFFFKSSISRINLQGKISTNRSSKGKISKIIFQRKNLHEQIFIKFFSKVQSPEKIFKEKSPRTNLQKEKSPFFKGKIFETIFQRKNLHEQIFLKKFQKSNGKISRINLQGKISTNKSSKRKNLHFSNEKSPKPYSKGKISMKQSSKGKISNE